MLPLVSDIEQVLTTSAPLQALLELKQLLQQFHESQGKGVMKRVVHFFNAQGFRQQFDEQEQELRDCLVQLSAILNTAQFTSQVCAAASLGTPLLLAQHCCFPMHAHHPLWSDHAEHGKRLIAGLRSSMTS
jgi:hypothetical protein